MDPVTHALASLALGRAAQKRLPRFGTTIILVGGVAADLDYASYFGGPESFLRFHRAVLHSIPGTVVVAAVTAVIFCFIDRRRPRQLIGNDAGAGSSGIARLRFVVAFVTAAIGGAGHILLDLASGVGVQPFWPFHVHLYAWNLLVDLDLWILIMLLAALLLPLLLRLVSEEIGDRKQRVRGRTAAILALGFIVVYTAGRAFLHGQAEDWLVSREYRGQVALSGGAFPNSSSPFEWRGVVVTDNTVEELNLSVGPHPVFDPDRSLTHYKPDNSPALQAGQQAGATQRMLQYTRFPLARMSRQEDGYRFELHDMQFASESALENVFLRVDLDSGLHIMKQQFLFASHPNP